MSVGSVLTKELARAGLNVSPQSQGKLLTYLLELERWNRTINLTSLQGVARVRRLVVEPVWIGQKLQMSGKLADIGSGNGSPGIPLLITRSLKEVHLVEARARRAAFLRHAAARLGSRGIVVHKIRAEDMTDSIDSVDWITLQAVSPAPRLIKVLARNFGPTTTVVWITAAAQPPVPGACRICVPSSNTEAWVFQLDQF